MPPDKFFCIFRIFTLDSPFYHKRSWLETLLEEILALKFVEKRTKSPLEVQLMAIAGECRELAELIKTHCVANLTFAGSTLDTPSVRTVFEAAPPLQFPEMWTSTGRMA